MRDFYFEGRALKLLTRSLDAVLVLYRGSVSEMLSAALL